MEASSNSVSWPLGAYTRCVADAAVDSAAFSLASFESLTFRSSPVSVFDAFSRSRSASRSSAAAAAVNALTAAAETGMAFCAKSPTASVMVCACVGTPPEENANRFFFDPSRVFVSAPETSPSFGSSASSASSSSAVLVSTPGATATSPESTVTPSEKCASDAPSSTQGNHAAGRAAAPGAAKKRPPSSSTHEHNAPAPGTDQPL